MKKFAVLVMAVAMMLSMSVFAANDAFTFDFYFDSKTPDSVVELWDDPATLNQGGSGNPIQKMDDYGVGYSSLNDKVIFKDIDFGANGAKKFTMFFSSNAADRAPTVDIFCDDTKLGSITLDGDTGGWTRDCAKPFSLDCEIPGGVHNITVQFTNSDSGSFGDIEFVEADPKPVEDEPAADTTADAGIVVACVVMAAAAAVVLSKKH